MTHAQSRLHTRRGLATRQQTSTKGSQQYECTHNEDDDDDDEEDMNNENSSMSRHTESDNNIISQH